MVKFYYISNFSVNIAFCKEMIWREIMKFQKIFVVIYALLLAFLMFSPSKLIGRSAIEKGDIKLKVHNQATTGPAYYLQKKDSDKLKENIKDTYPSINTSAIELIGNTPFHLINDPIELGSFTVYGKVVDVTSKYKSSGDGVIPVFEVSYWDVPFKKLFLIQYHWFFIAMFVLFPVFIINAVILLKSYEFKNR